MRSESKISEPHRLPWAFALRCLLVLGTFATAWYGLKTCGEISDYQIYYRDLLGGKPLPPITRWVFDYRSIFMLAILIVPGAALATFFIRDPLSASLALIGLIVFAALVGLLVFGALQLPLHCMVTSWAADRVLNPIS